MTSLSDVGQRLRDTSLSSLPLGFSTVGSIPRKSGRVDCLVLLLWRGVLDNGSRWDMSETWLGSTSEGYLGTGILDFYTPRVTGVARKASLLVVVRNACRRT